MLHSFHLPTPVVLGPNVATGRNRQTETLHSVNEWAYKPEKQILRGETPILHHSCVTGVLDAASVSLLMVAVTWFQINFCYRDRLSHSDCSSQGLKACCTCTHFSWSFVALYLLALFFYGSINCVSFVSIWNNDVVLPVCGISFINYILQLFISLCYSGCNRARRPDRCHVDLIATATSKKHRPQLFRGWNQGCVSLCLYGFSFSLPHPLYVHGLSVARVSL